MMESIYDGDELDAVDTNVREIQTPEGVPLRLTVASLSHRVAGFGVDMTIVILAIVAAVIALIFLVDDPFSGWVGALLILCVFLVRNFYFVWFELRNQGQTPGKRLAGTRVIDIHGRPLEANAVFVRNVTRDLELFLPLMALIAPEALWPGGPWWGRMLAGVWLLILALMPLFNRNRLRVGDLMAGTMVVINPRVELLEDIGAKTRAEASKFTFTSDQLDMYGIYELQVLEDLLRKDTDFDSLSQVAKKIVQKIGYKTLGWQLQPLDFLNAFYTALRARLEHKMLLGKRQERKRAGRLGESQKPRNRP